MSTPARPLIYAHRGASADHPENTLPAFLAAHEQGSDWVELDVHLAADGELVVVHDQSYSDGRQVDEHPGATRPATVPLLDAALDACAGMGVNIEIKVTRPGTDLADRVVELVGSRRAAGADQPICISSFDEVTLDRVRSLDPAVDTAQLHLRPRRRPRRGRASCVQGRRRDQPVGPVRRRCAGRAVLGAGPGGQPVDGGRPQPDHRAGRAGGRRHHHQHPRAGTQLPHLRCPDQVGTAWLSSLLPARRR